MEIRVARTLLIAVRPQFVAAREDTLRRAVDLRQLFRTRAQRTDIDTALICPLVCFKSD